MKNESTKSSPRFTVFTAVYNRRNAMMRAWRSLLAQSNTDFEWLIIDDGSTDQLSDDIDIYISESPFVIKYFYKENGGKASAINAAYGKAAGEYFVTLDSDDELMPDALKIFESAWQSIPESSRGRYWSICSLCQNAESGDLIGNKFSENINQVSNSKRKFMLSKSVGERMGCQKLSIIKEFPFPQFPDTQFVPEGMIWKSIDKKYLQYYINEITLKINLSEDSITQQFKFKTPAKYASSYYYARYVVNECKELIFYAPKTFLIKLIDFTRSGVGSGRRLIDILSDAEGLFTKLIVLLTMPIGFIVLTRDGK